MEDIHTIRTDLPTPEEVAPKVLSGTKIWWNYTANCESTRRPFSAPATNTRYHAPRPVEAWTSGRALTSGHVSPVVQSARLILQKYDNLTRNKQSSRVSSSSDTGKMTDFIICQPRQTFIKAGNEKTKGHTFIENGNRQTGLPLSIQSRSLSNINDQSAFVRNQRQCLLSKDDRQMPIVQFAEEEKERINGLPEAVFLTEVRNDWTGFRKKPVKVSFNVAVDNGFSKHVKNWSPKVYNSKIHHLMETVQE